MGDKLPILSADGGSVSASEHSGGTSHITAQPPHYEELLGGVPCPSCNGTGRIPKELEKTLVALIPLTDNRLKPRRTLTWVALAVSVSLLTCGLLLFFLVPRSLTLSTDEPAITNIEVLSYDDRRLVISFWNSIGVTNDNFFGVKMINATSSVEKIIFPDSHEVIGKGINTTRLSVPMKVQNHKVWINNTVVITDWAYQICVHYYGYVRLYFQFTLTFEYFNHQEQETRECSQLVCCKPTSNCTQMALMKTSPRLA